MPHSSRRILPLIVTLIPLLTGCTTFGPGQIEQDQLGYTKSLGETQKRETLLNAVRLRYGDTPTFLQATQVIAGYQLQRNATGGFQLFPSASPSTFLTGSGSVQLQQSPTFTFQPLTGEQFAQSSIRPLSPSDLMPLAMGGVPIDVLFRLGVQSINGMDNSMALTNVGATGDADFFVLLYDLRQLQMAGLLAVSQQPAAPPQPATGKQVKPPPPEAKPAEKGGGRIFLSITDTGDEKLGRISAQVKRMLGMAPKAHEAEVVYGRFAPRKGEIAMLTRPVLGVLEQLAIQMDVPSDDVVKHRTLPTVGNVGLEDRPVVVIHSGPDQPKDAFAAIRYHGTWFWIAEDDFDSKLAFSVLQILIALAQTGSAPGTVITIPTG